MPNIRSYGYSTSSTPQKRSSISEQNVTITVRSRNGSLQTTFCIEEPDATPVHDLASICRQLFRHVAALVRLVLSLCVVPSKVTATTCRSLGNGFLGWLEGGIYDVPRQARLLEGSLKSYMRHRWPRTWGFMHRNIAPLIQLMQNLIDDRDAMRQSTNTSAVWGSDASMEDHFEDIVMARLTRSPSVPSAQFEYAQNRRSWSQISPSPALDDIPSLEELSASNTLTNMSYASSSGAEHPPDTGYHRKIQGISPENPPKHEKTASEQCQMADQDVAVFELGERSPAMIKEIVESPTDALEPPQEFPVVSIRPIQSSGDANLDRLWDGATTYNPNVATPHGDISSPSSDAAGDESFSSVHLPPPHAGRNESPTGSPHVQTNYLQEGHEIEQPSSMPYMASDTPKSQLYETSTIPSSQYAPSTMLGSRSSTSTTLNSHSPSSTKDASLKVTKPTHNSKRSLLDFQAGYGTPCHPKNEVDCCNNRTVSCHEEPHTPTTKSSRQQTSEADQCDETCISCETCDRRHKRTRRSSKIPRRIKTFKQIRARSCSPSSCRTTGSTGSTGTVVRKKLQKKKRGKGH